MLRDRAEVPTGADNDRGRYVVVRNPHAAFLPQAFDWRRFEYPRARTPQQVIVELASADRVADDVLVLRFNRFAPHQSCSETRDVLEGESCGPVFLRIQFEQFEHPGGKPARTHLVSGKPCPVGNDDIPSGPSKLAGARRTRGPSTHDQRVAPNHADAPGDSKGSERVQEGGTDSLGANTTWKSCIHPVVNAASDPERYSSQARANSGLNRRLTSSLASANLSAQHASVRA